MGLHGRGGRCEARTNHEDYNEKGDEDNIRRYEHLSHRYSYSVINDMDEERTTKSHRHRMVFNSTLDRICSTRVKELTDHLVNAKALNENERA